MGDHHPQQQARGRTTRRALAAAAVAFMLGLWLMPSSGAQGQPIIINEIVASNSQIFPDGDGDFTDWVELYNPNGEAVDLGGYQISDSGATWPIPFGTTIEGNGYLIIFASDKGDPLDDDFPGPDGELHANFQLTSNGETVTLTNALFQVDDSVTYPQLATDTSYGTDGADGYVIRDTADVTPNAANTGVEPTATPTPPPTVGDPSLVINEVMASNDTFLADGGDDFEDWLEIYNPTCATIDLAGWTIADSATGWQFPSVVLAPGDAVLVWASDKGAPDDPDFPGPDGELHTNFRISAGGETLSLLDPDGLLIAQVLPPALEADQAAVRQADGSYVIATGAGVTPGEANPGQTPPACPTATPTPTPTVTPTVVGPTPTPTPTVQPTATPTATPVPVDCAGTVVVNELMSRNDGIVVDGDGDFPDWVELHNTTGADIDLSGWTISDDFTAWTFPAGTVIAADGYVIVFASDKGDPDDPGFPGPAGELHANFRLAGAGETVTVRDPGGCVADALAYPDVDDDRSFGRLPGGGTGEFVLGYITPGAPNGQQSPPNFGPCYSSGDYALRINRIVASNQGLLLDGDGDDPDFVELLNYGLVAIDLTFWQISDSGDTWVFPPGTVIEPNGGTLIVWASDKGFVLDDDHPGPAGELHTNFALSADGEIVTLAEPSSCIVEQVEFPALGGDEAYGYDADGNRAILLPGSSTAACAAPGSVRISALMSRNDGFAADEDGEFSDWFELTNVTDAAIDLSRWVISDDNATWIAPDGAALEAGETVRIWASGNDRKALDSPFHTNFALSGDGETLSIGSSADCPVDSVTFGELDDDQVFALDLDTDTYSVTGGSSGSDDDDDDGDGEADPGEITITGRCIAITELMAKNDSTIDDAEGEFGDWIELTNLGDDPIDLSGWTIADDGDEWTFPDGVEIEPGDFLLVWADEVDTDDPEGELHTNFKLASEGEPITLTDADGVVAASISTYPELDDDESFGVNDEGIYALRSAGDATPGEGPTVDGGCDFEVSVASAGVAAEPASAAEADGDESADTAAGAEADAASGADGDDVLGASDLAVTGTSVQWPALLAQLLLVAGVVLTAMAAVSRRRSAI